MEVLRQLEIRGNKDGTQNIYICGEKLQNCSQFQLNLSPFEVPTAIIELRLVSPHQIQLDEVKAEIRFGPIVIEDKKTLMALRERIDEAIGVSDRASSGA